VVPLFPDDEVMWQGGTKRSNAYFPSFEMQHRTLLCHHTEEIRNAALKE
jgi:hypothetical protein